MSGVDPAFSGESDIHYSLGAVYTALLLTATPDPEGEPQWRGRPAEDEIHTAKRRMSALAMLNAGSRLVLLGRPGSGKSSFVSFVARCLCAEALGRSDAGLALLTTPLPEKDEKEPKPQPWEHGALLPVIVTLRDFAASPHFPAPGEKGVAKHLADFITVKLQTYKCEDFAPHLLAEMQNRSGRCLLLLDGLDEVPDADQKRGRLKQVVEECAKAFPGCRILVTSRPYAYSAWRLDGFAEATLGPFTEAQINVFIQRWYTHIAPKRKLSPEIAAARAGQLQRVIASNERLREFAGTPLLLTLMASLHAARSGDLPDKRAALYQDAVDLLLKKWEADKGLTGLLPVGAKLTYKSTRFEYSLSDRVECFYLLQSGQHHAKSQRQNQCPQVLLPSDDQDLSALSCAIASVLDAVGQVCGDSERAHSRFQFGLPM